MAVKTIFGIVGSGKTEKCVKDVINLLKDNSPIGIVIVSFTKATRNNFIDRFLREASNYELETLNFSSFQDFKEFLKYNIRTLHSLALEHLLNTKGEIKIFEEDKEALTKFKFELYEKFGIEFNPKKIEFSPDTEMIKIPLGNILFQCFNYIYNSIPEPTEEQKIELVKKFAKLTNATIYPKIYLEFEKFLFEFLEKNNLTTFTLMLLEFYKYLKNSPYLFEYVVVDEAQELTNLMFLIVELLGNNVYLYGDLAQRIYYVFGENDKVINILINSKTEFLNKTYRIPSGISSLINKIVYRIYGKYGLSFPEIEYEKSGGNYEIRNSNEYTLEQIIKEAYYEMLKGKKVAVLFRHNRTLLRARKIAMSLNIPTTIFSGVSYFYLDIPLVLDKILEIITKENNQLMVFDFEFFISQLIKELKIDNEPFKIRELVRFLNYLKYEIGFENLNEETIKELKQYYESLILSTIHSFKGFEADVVYLVFDFTTKKFLETQEIEVIYTALTRAKEKLVIYGKPSTLRALGLI